MASPLHSNGISNGITAPDDSLTPSYRNRYQQLKDYDGLKNGLIEELLYKLDQLTEAYTQLYLDREREVHFNRDIQQRTREKEVQAQKMRLYMDRNPFVLVLLDGDGMIFQDHLLQKAEQGGRDAAGYLWTAVRDYVQRELPDLSSDCKIVCRVYANLKGLADICVKAGIVDKASKIEDFARGFTRSKHLFDFIDVGSGKDRADEKLCEVFKLHLYDCHCRHVLFGCSHDNGYARLLEDIITDPASTQRVCLLEGYPFERELSILCHSFKSIKFDTLFRPTRISIAPAYQPVAPHPLYAISTSSSSSLLPTMPVATFSSNPVPLSWASAVASPPTTPQPPQATNTSATHNGTGTHHSISISRNRFGQRIDPEVKYDRFDVKRVKALKMCNVHHLRGDCPYGSDCTHTHDSKPTASELNTLRYIARLAPCRMGTDCEDPKCIYGHRCPAGDPCAWGDTCRFPTEMHGLDLNVVKSVKV